MKSVLLRIEEPLKQALEESAHEHGRSLNMELVKRLATSIEQDSAVYRLAIALGRVMNAAGQKAADLAGEKDWMQSPWCYQQAAHAARRVLEGLCPPGDIIPPPLEVDPELVAEVGEEQARLFIEANQRRLGFNVAGYLLSQGSGNVYEQAKEFQSDLGELAERLKRGNKK